MGTFLNFTTFGTQNANLVHFSIAGWHSSAGSFVGGIAQLVVASSLMLKGIGFDPG